MKARSFFLLLLLVSLVTTAAANTNPKSLAKNVTSENSAVAERAIAEVRAMGPAGLELLFRTYAKEIDQQVANPLLQRTPEWLRLSAALDAVSQQKNSYVSGLYWYTDLDEARKAARIERKPILSLRLLGKLSDEFSCANSRFFRTVLYANADVARMLRDKFILHWSSERPVPRVTIDFGDGRKLERTITGNSIHYVLDSDGRVIDALPGLYGPAKFTGLLAADEAIFRGVPQSQVSAFNGPSYLRQRLNAINVAWYADIQKTGGKIPEGLLSVQKDANGALTAVEVMRFAVSKAMTETTLVRSILAPPATLETITDQQTWTRIAQLHGDEARLDARSLGLIRRQTQGVLFAADENQDKALAALVQKLEQNIAIDTVRNEYLMHTKLYAWLMFDSERDMTKLNKKVYAELFQTPAGDPWLGLFPPDVYTALDRGGLR